MEKEDALKNVDYRNFMLACEATALANRIEKLLEGIGISVEPCTGSFVGKVSSLFYRQADCMVSIAINSLFRGGQDGKAREEVCSALSCIKYESYLETSEKIWREFHKD